MPFTQGIHCAIGEASTQHTVYKINDSHKAPPILALLRYEDVVLDKNSMHKVTVWGRYT